MLQELIHKLEVGGGARYFRWGLVMLALAMLCVGYNWRAFRNMSTQEAMDSAQLARNIADGKGYTTLFVRPFSMYLVKKRNLAKQGVPPPGTVVDLASIKRLHPDLANPPVYPYVLAGLMKVVHFRYAADMTRPFWSNGGQNWRYQPDFIISAFDQVLFLGVVVLVFFLARRLFGPALAWPSAIVVLGTELFWRFSVSGLSTSLLLLIFVGLAWCLVAIEGGAREARRGPVGLLVLGLAVGILVGLGALTRYSFAWLIIPVVAFLAAFGGRQRVVLALAAFMAFAALLAPWVVRNYSVSGTPFGTAGYALVETWGPFQGDRLQRSLEPDFTGALLGPFWHKLPTNIRQIVRNDLPRLGGSWVTAFFLVGLLVPLRNPGATRLRYFLLGSLALLLVVQALGRTQLSEDSPEINSENLLVLLAPLVLMFGVAFFFVLFDQIEMPFRELRYVALGFCGVVACLPMIQVFMPPSTRPVAFPPYYPPLPQITANYTKENELTVSDMPWAMAWYGQRQCVWLNSPADLLAVNDFQKPVQAVMLTSLTLDKLDAGGLLPAMVGTDQSWETLVLQSMPRFNPDPERWPLRIDIGVRQASGTIAQFPLHYWQKGWPQQFVLTANQHFSKTP